MYIKRKLRFGDTSSLVVMLEDLEYPQNEYDWFRIRINDGNWKYIDVTPRAGERTKPIIFTNIDTPTVNVFAECMHNSIGYSTRAVFVMEEYSYLKPDRVGGVPFTGKPVMEPYRPKVVKLDVHIMDELLLRVRNR